MQLYATGAEVARLEATLDAARGPARAGALIELAWQLRQRDSARAVALIESAEPLLAAEPMTPEAAQVLRGRISLTLAEVSALYGSFEVAEMRLTDARARWVRRLDPPAEGDAWLAESIVAKARGQRDRELASYAAAARSYAAAFDRPREAVATAWLAYERVFTSPDTGGSEAPEPDRVGERDAASLARDALRSAERGVPLSRRDPAQAADVLLRASEQAQQAGLLRHAVVCTMNAGTALQGLGDYDLAAGCFELAATVARKTGWPALIGSSQTRLGGFLKELGRLEDSRTALVEALASFAVTPGGINKANASSALANTLLALGQAAESVGPMSDAVRMYREARSTDNLALCLIGLARALSAAGRPVEALAAIDETCLLIAQHGFTALDVGVNEALTEIHRQHPLPSPPGMTAPTAAVHYAEATLAAGQRIKGWRAPAALFVTLADVWAEAGDLSRAYDHARRALAAKDQEAALRLNHPLAVLRLRRESELPPGTASTPWAPSAPAPLEIDGQGGRALAAGILTAKEREVLRLLARNFSNKEIASALDVGDETVKWHLKNIYNKLKAGSRKHAVTRARTLGVLDLSS